MGEADKVTVKVLFFAKSRELTGLNEAYLQVRSGRVNGIDLVELIIEDFPGVAVLKDNLLLSINQEYLEKNETVEISGGEEVAVIPPISGG